jgi:hypothetical protein
MALGHSLLLLNANDVWVIDEDVPVESAASGVINPITVIVGIVDTIQKMEQQRHHWKRHHQHRSSLGLGKNAQQILSKEKTSLY